MSMKNAKKNRPEKKNRARFSFSFKLAVAAAVAGGVVFGAAAGAVLVFTRDLPQIRGLEDYRPSAITRIYSRDGAVLAELYKQRRTPVPLSRMPAFLKTAVLTTEDRNFYRHSGVDIKGVARALVRDLMARKFKEGASTITQQLVKTLFLTPDKRLERKVKEAVLAIQLERRYTKDEILEMYLNQIYLGSGAFGVAAAAKTFFGEKVEDLTLAQCALIAAMPKAPSVYSPLVNPDLAKKRRDIVLNQMLKQGEISPEQHQKAVKEPPAPAGRPASAIGPAPYFVDAVKQILEKELGSARLYQGGLTVNTTLDHTLQVRANQAVDRGLKALYGRMGENGISNPSPQAALVAVDVASGAILAMVGGSDYTKTPFNRAASALRQPGSAFKPIFYALAMEEKIPQNRLVADSPLVLPGRRPGEKWRPENFSKTFGGKMTLRYALAKSVNIPAVRLLMELEPEKAARFAKKLGISSPLSNDLTLALGSSPVSLLELTCAYAVFANKGNRALAFMIAEVLDASGRILYRPKPVTAAAMSRTAAAITMDMLKGVIRSGTGKDAQKAGGVLAGKTGTTNDFRDALFVGFSPEVAAGVWVGNDDYTPLGNGETGARAALPIWTDFMTLAVERRGVSYFDFPDATVKVWMDPVTGNRAEPGAPGAVPALFEKGAAPALPR